MLTGDGGETLLSQYIVGINSFGSAPGNMRTMASLAPKSLLTYDRHLYTLPLGYVEHTAVRRPDERAGVHGPQSAQHPEQRRLAASVGAGDQQVFAGFHRQCQTGHDYVAVRRHNGHVVQRYAAIRAVFDSACKTAHRSSVKLDLLNINGTMHCGME